MGYNDDPYRDEDGEALMDYDEIHSDSEQEQQPEVPQDDDVVQDFNDDDDDGGDNWGMPDEGTGGSPEPESSKPRKRLIKKSAEVSTNEDLTEPYVPADFTDFDEVDVGGETRYGDEDGYGEQEEEEEEERAVSRKRKEKGVMREDGGGSGEKRRKEKKLRKEKFGSGGGGSGGKPKLSLKRRKSSSGGGGGEANTEEADVNEMWATIAGADSEDDQEGVKTLDDDNFIDDTGVDPADRYTDAGSPSHFAEAEEGEEEDIFRSGKKKKKNEKSAAEIADLVERLMAELEVVAEEDAVFNMQGKPAINKLKKLPLLVDALSKKQLQHEFLDHGVLTLLKNWLEPLPDGSLPNINIREAILRILTDFPIDLEQHDRKEQLKRSGLGKVIMFLSRSDEETTTNRKLAKELVDKWSRPIFSKSTRYDYMRETDAERNQRRPPMRKPASKPSRLESQDDDLEFSSGRKAGPSASRMLTTRPEATPMDFVIRPQSKINPNEIRARAKQGHQDERRMKMNKKLQQMKQSRRKNLQASKVSVEGRGMVKYL